MNRFSERYGFAFMLIIATLIVSAAVGDKPVGAFVIPAMLGACLVVTLQASDVRPRVVRLFTVIAVAGALAGGLAAIFGQSDSGRGLSTFIAVAFVVISPIAIFRDVRRRPDITMKTVMGAVCAYLFLGLFFALVYRIMGVYDPPFFVQTPETTVPDTLYFSFITLATVGYGDLTAAGQVTRMLTATEGLLGQVYLVTIVAVLVSNLGRSRRPPEQQPQQPED